MLNPVESVPGPESIRDAHSILLDATNYCGALDRMKAALCAARWFADADDAGTVGNNDLNALRTIIGGAMEAYGEHAAALEEARKAIASD
ncbi:hypothetical protein H0I76_09955 [Limibaculum sp. M0105]|uniref:Uncharacterized protein n=1 Tax=Thermohalobaculum xanthum TaxID=2753746 RepID=A0A8J7SH76_9RHOB|nr:hypothetical protein [Thermohalobaculum xanthum]MBK0399515.1 hypothetical protein [Thermohalobaculum xanthum]